MPEAAPAPSPSSTPAPAAIPVAAATPAANPAPQAPAAAPQASPAPVAPAIAAGDKPAAEPAKAESAKAPEVVKSLIGDGEVKAPEGDKPADKAAEKPVEGDAPVYDIKLPEGVEADPALIDQAKAIFTEAKVAPEIAQKLTTFHGEQMKALGDALVAKQYEAWNTTISGWQQEVFKDPELGGAKFGETKNRIETGLQTFFGISPTTPADAPERKAHADFIGVLKYTGAGSTLPMIRLLNKIASRGAEGKPVAVGGPSPQKKSAAELMYGNKQAAE